MNIAHWLYKFKNFAINHFYFRLSFHFQLLQTNISLQNIEKMRKQRFYDINNRI